MSREYSEEKPAEDVSLEEKLGECRLLLKSLERLLVERDAIKKKAEGEDEARGNVQGELDRKEGDIRSLMSGGARNPKANWWISGDDLLGKMFLEDPTEEQVKLACGYFDEILENIDFFSNRENLNKSRYFPSEGKLIFIDFFPLFFADIA
ncbi:MAG: hypothetical protein N3A38_17365, partial [Planctomycetota bacterium]|nr:hypothetical protein [Planctomycetota bacterium]